MEKKQLQERIIEYTKKDCVIAFSGGVDSSLLLKLFCKEAKKQKTKVYAVMAYTKLHPIHDIEIAKTLAKEMGAIFELITVDELKEAEIENNPVNRCYLCKKFIFYKIKKFAEEKKVTQIFEGTNQDDLTEYRPGLKALKELEIISPLAECGITKKEVRVLAAKEQISVAKRPSTPCLATRIPYGDFLDYELLRKIELAETFLRKRGYYNVRVRMHQNLARIEVDAKDIMRLIEDKNEIINQLKMFGFDYITVDLEGFRSGSMDIRINKEVNAE